MEIYHAHPPATAPPYQLGGVASSSWGNLCLVEAKWCAEPHSKDLSNVLSTAPACGMRQTTRGIQQGSVG